jgi:DNA topoisomerase I
MPQDTSSSDDSLLTEATVAEERLAEADQIDQGLSGADEAACQAPSGAVPPAEAPCPGRSPGALKACVERGARARWWRRLGSKERGFRYVDAGGNRVTDEAALERVKSLAIPPAWRYVRISPARGGRLQAVGVDTSGRVQYLYHPKYVERQARRKYEKIERFGAALPRLRRRSNEDIALDGLPRERVLAVVLRLINDLYFRLGSEESVERYRTFGVTTLRNRHLTIRDGGRLDFNFVGKHHIRHRRVLVDEDLASLVAEIKALKGSRLFNYLDADAKPRAITPRDVNAYIKETIGEEFSAKDFRTWGATLRAAVELAELGPPANEKTAAKNIRQVVKRVAEHLGNTPTVCRNCYIHPLVLEQYQKGVSLNDYRRRAERIIRRRQEEHDVEEVALLQLFRDASGAAAAGAGHESRLAA